MNTIKTQSANIVCIDDDPEILSGLTQLLMSSGHSCRCCSDRETAIASVQHDTPDLFVVDINLGQESGLDLCEDLRRMEHLTDVPVIFLSAAEMPNIVRRTKAAGGTYFLRNPYDSEVMLELIDKALWMPHVAGSHVS